MDKDLCTSKCPAYKKLSNTIDKCSLCEEEAASGWHKCWMTDKLIKTLIKEYTKQLKLIDKVMKFKEKK